MKHNIRCNYIKYIFYIVFFVILDQLSKKLTMDYLLDTQYRIIHVTSFFDLVYSWNYGISFGLFGQYADASNIFFLIMNSLIVFYLFYMLFDKNNQFCKIALALIISGAVGNLVDRVIYSKVFDFLSFHYKGYFFPAFNFADSFISIGGFMLFVQLIFFYDSMESKSDEK